MLQHLRSSKLLIATAVLTGSIQVASSSVLKYAEYATAAGRSSGLFAHIRKVNPNNPTSVQQARVARIIQNIIRVANSGLHIYNNKSEACLLNKASAWKNKYSIASIAAALTEAAIDTKDYVGKAPAGYISSDNQSARDAAKLAGVVVETLAACYAAYEQDAKAELATGVMSFAQFVQEIANASTTSPKFYAYAILLLANTGALSYDGYHYFTNNEEPDNEEPNNEEPDNEESDSEESDSDK